MSALTPAVAAALEAELRLLAPEVRADADLLGTLLHPEYREVGTCGRHWDRATVLAAAADGPPRPLTTTGIRGVELAPDIVHLTFETESHGRRAHRSSLWRRSGERWLLWFHQGTPYGTAPAVPEVAQPAEA
ncbi:DUF4440 domain-containing protein [Streptomyces sp. NPDC090025]|uniref:nuclear transport factor 2 family protein n=1 Tax=Streptomyces sp. NPDC090025 TaxID=3365922 RepID=UPI003838B93B